LGLLQTIINGLLDDFGYPATVRHMLAKYNGAGAEAPDICVSLELPRSIAVSSVPAWHELSGSLTDGGVLRGWHAERGGYYTSFHANLPEYKRLAKEHTVHNWECDITQVDGFSSSKSKLGDFQTTDEMVEANSQKMISPIDQAKLDENLAHKEIRIIHDPKTSDCFAQYRWDKRTWLLNSGGSHHFAAAKYIAARLGVKVPLKGKLRTYELDIASLQALRTKFEMFAISDDSFVSNAFNDAMRAFKATWLWHDLPRPYRGVRAILLPKDEPRSQRVAAELRRVGVIDLGSHLMGLAAS
jgi:hypothetical protein